MYCLVSSVIQEKITEKFFFKENALKGTVSRDGG
jgi:hypothetical protein